MITLLRVWMGGCGKVGVSVWGNALLVVMTRRGPAQEVLRTKHEGWR